MGLVREMERESFPFVDDFDLSLLLVVRGGGKVGRKEWGGRERTK